MEKRINFFWIAGFFLPAINATVFRLFHFYLEIFQVKNRNVFVHFLITSFFPKAYWRFSRPLISNQVHGKKFIVLAFFGSLIFIFMQKKTALKPKPFKFLSVFPVHCCMPVRLKFRPSTLLQPITIQQNVM